MSNIDCDDSKYSNTSVCACKKGIDSYIAAQKSYQDSLDQHNAEDASWSEWNTVNNQREQITGGYATYYNRRKNEYNNDTRDTRNYMDTENARHGNHDDYCINDYGADWINIPEDTSNANKTLKYSHPGFFFLKCLRTDSAIDRIIKEEMLRDLPAHLYTSDHRTNWTSSNRPVFAGKAPNPLNITCCTQIIDAITAGESVDINNISQKCGNSTENQNGSDTENEDTEENGSTNKLKEFLKKYYIYIIVILTILLIISIISSFLLGGSDNSENIVPNNFNNYDYNNYDYNNY